MENNIKNILFEILDKISGIEESIQGIGFDDFRNDRKIKIFVVQALQSVFALLMAIPDSFKIENKQINWKIFVDIEQDLIDNPYGIDDEIVWKTAKNNLRTLSKNLSEIMN